MVRALGHIPHGCQPLGRDVIDTALFAAPAGHGAVDVVCRDVVEVKGGRARLERVLQNLVDNALTYSVPGHGVHVVVTQDEGGRMSQGRAGPRSPCRIAVR